MGRLIIELITWTPSCCADLLLTILIVKEITIMSKPLVSIFFPA